MPIRKPAAEFKSALLTTALLGIAALAITPRACLAETGFRLERDPQGLIRPFQAVAIPLPKFVREYARLTSTPIAVDGPWDKELKGTVTLFVRRALKLEELTEIFHRVLSENGFAVVDAPADNGWVIEPARQARDAALPVYELGEVPDSSRLVTAYHDFKYADAEEVSRTMRSFMPANSRIIPTTPSQVFITDTASNIKKLGWLIARIDTEETAKGQKAFKAWYSPQPSRACGETRIEKLTVEKLEIKDSGTGSMNGFQPKPSFTEGAKK